MKRASNIFKIISGFLLTLIIIGLIYEQRCRMYFDQFKPAKNEFISVDDGRMLHFCKKGNGDTTIIFESGIGGDHLYWQEIQEKLSKRFTTLSYDRAGILWSDYADSVSLKQYKKDLKKVITKTACPKPYILVGHSFAGITLRSFIADNLKDIQGVVLIDAAHPQHKLEASLAPLPRWLIKLLNKVGILRLIYSTTAFTNAVEKDHWFNQNIGDYFYRILPGLMVELNSDGALMLEADKIKKFGDIPLCIMTAKYPNGVERIKDSSLSQEYIDLHHKLQKDLLNLSSKSHQIFAEESGHYITLQQPDLVIKAVNEIALIPKERKIRSYY